MRGLYGKYIIQKASGKPLGENFYAIVLRIDGGRYLKACRVGVKAFADAVREENPILAADIERKLKELSIKTYPIILDACRDCPDRHRCHRTFEEVVRCKRTDKEKVA